MASIGVILSCASNEPIELPVCDLYWCLKPCFLWLFVASLTPSPRSLAGEVGLSGPGEGLFLMPATAVLADGAL